IARGPKALHGVNAMADEHEKPSSRGPSGLIALILLAASAVVVKQLPYTTARPEIAERAPISNDSPMDVNARLWQDPFGAVDQHKREVARDRQAGLGGEQVKRRHGVASFRENLKGNLAKEVKSFYILPVYTFGGAYAEDAENRRRTRYAVLSALAMHG